MIVVPEVTPVTTPEAFIVAVVAPPLLHVPPVVASLNVVVPGAHTVIVPVIADGIVFTVTIAVAVQPIDV